MEYRMATVNDIDKFVETRIEFVTLIRKIDDVQGFRENTREYLRRNIGTENLTIYLAIDKGKIVSSCLASIFTTIPVPSCNSGKSADILNVYTIPEYRRRGIAKKLLIMLIEEMKKSGVNRLVLEATEDGYPLYKQLGFKAEERSMALKL